MYLPSFPSEEACDVADSIRKEISMVTNPLVTVSCGIASWSSIRRPDGNEIVRQADQALYKAKRNGKNRLIIAEALVTE